ncbi:MAG: 3-hydroxyacyl-CoA dehydrogenase/enoyl-CoA hydratase family protein [Planctomycetota bacterium]|nr:MAG: 3-hydroxyacyl-CoA dehydrogenase/enoyl-CoA hydratase family protein [Planctomycetota bacterium]
MSYAFQGRTLEKVGVIGSGQIGPDIALHFAKVLSPSQTPVVVVDVSEDALASGEKKLHKKVERGQKSGAFKQEQADAIKAGVRFTSDYEALRGASLVVEAATEDVGIKGKIFTQLEGLCPADAILCSNSSHLEPEVIFAPVERKQRTCVVHYFFPAERNRALEVVPGADTDPALTAWLLAFYEAIGKVPVPVKSRYGYAVDPIFEGLLLTSALLVEEGVATSKEVDAVAQRVLGLGVGPFTAHNLTGGNPITAHGLAQLHEKVSPWFRVPDSLRERVERGEDWEVPARGEEVSVGPKTAQAVGDALRATYYGLVCEALDAGLATLADLETVLEIALVIDAPFASMNSLGTRRALELVRAFAAKHPGFPVAKCLVAQGEADRPWEIPYVLREDRDGVAVLTIRRPKVLNALNADVFAQLAAHAEAIEADDDVVGAVLTGHGTKAFVSGADVGFLAGIETPEQGIETSRRSQAAVGKIAALSKPTVAALNGLAFGGGLELALCCDAILARKGLRVLAGQPEPNLGIIPGAGGTQRLPRRIGIEAAARMLRTGKPISSAEAAKLGLVREEVDGDVVAAAIDLVRRAAAGEARLEPVPEGPLDDVPDALPEVDLGHLSRAVDAIIVRAILEGARKPLAEGLDLEAQLFGEVVRLEDMRIGIETFLNKGPRAKAPFVHH